MQLKQQIGEGSYGNIFRGVLRDEGGLPCAVKVAKQFPEESQNSEFINAVIKKRTTREEQFLRRFKHPNIVRLLRVNIDNNQQRTLVLELLDCPLFEWMAAEKVHSGSPVFQRVVHELLSALAFIHKQGYTHRDLKPENIMVVRNRPKLIDFGFVRNLGSIQAITPEVVSLAYRAPELLLGLPYSPKIDVWSLGVILFQLVQGYLPFKSSNELSMLCLIIKRLGRLPYKMANSAFTKFRVKVQKERQPLVFAKAPATLQALISRMLVIDPEERISAEEAMAHQFFAEYLLKKALRSPDPRAKKLCRRGSQNLRVNQSSFQDLKLPRLRLVVKRRCEYSM